jgi:hypothetical protein
MEFGWELPFEIRQDNSLFNTREDRPISLTKGRKSYDRKFTIAKDVPLGEQKFDASLWRGAVGDSSKSRWIAGKSIPIEIVD